MYLAGFPRDMLTDPSMLEGLDEVVSRVRKPGSCPPDPASPEQQHFNPDLPRIVSAVRERQRFLSIRMVRIWEDPPV